MCFHFSTKHSISCSPYQTTNLETTNPEFSRTFYPIRLFLTKKQKRKNKLHNTYNSCSNWSKNSWKFGFVESARQTQVTQLVNFSSNHSKSVICACIKGGFYNNEKLGIAREILVTHLIFFTVSIIYSKFEFWRVIRLPVRKLTSGSWYFSSKHIRYSSSYSHSILKKH